MDKIKRPFDESNRLEGYQPVTPDLSPRPAEPNNEPSAKPKVAAARSESKPGNATDYSTKYLNQPQEVYPKKIYISKEFHSRIDMIVKILGNGDVKLTLSGFLHNILTEHFTKYGDEIDRLLRENFDSRVSFGKTKNEK